MKAVIIGCVFLAASIAYLCYEYRRAPLIDPQQGRAALDRAKRANPQPPVTQADADADITALIQATREDMPLSMAWCDPGDVDRIDELVHVWARQQEGR